jgi:hypothetical protein
VGFDLGFELWMKDAACADKPREWFFPERGQSTRRARAICAICTVGPECEDYADRTNTQYGVWNGKIRQRGAVESNGHTSDALTVHTEVAPNPPEPPREPPPDAAAHPLGHLRARL